MHTVVIQEKSITCNAVPISNSLKICMKKHTKKKHFFFFANQMYRYHVCLQVCEQDTDFEHIHSNTVICM